MNALSPAEPRTLACAPGGFRGVPAGWRILHHRAVAVDLLMLLAALGAALRGAPLEGAILLALYFLANFLQHFALSRTRQVVPGQARSEQTVLQQWVDEAAPAYALVVVLLAAILGLVLWLVLLQPLPAALYRTAVFVVVAAPCALLISTPIAVLSALGGAARRGIFFQDGRQLERLAATQVVAFSMNGTLTCGRPEITDIIASGGHSVFPWQHPGAALDLLRLAAAVERRSDHPLAHAIVAAAQDRRLSLPACSHFTAIGGQAVAATVNHRRIVAGSAEYFRSFHCHGMTEAEARLGALQHEGKSCVLVGEVSDDGVDVRILGLIAARDAVQPEAATVVARLRQLGVQRVVLLTAASQRVAESVAREIGVDEVRAELSPEDKAGAVQELRALGPLALVGHDAGDAAALAAADVGLTMGQAQAASGRESAGIILMPDQLQQVALALCLSHRARRVVAQNLGFSLCAIAVLAVVTLASHMPLPGAMLLHEGSVAVVCLNGLRLLIKMKPAPCAPPDSPQTGP